MWILECLPEIESDMSVFHRIEDIYTMNAFVFVRRALLLPVYEGAVRGAVRRLAEKAAQRDTDTPNVARVAQEDDEAALWAAYRQRKYAKFLKPGEVPRVVSVAEGMALASQAFQGVS